MCFHIRTCIFCGAEIPPPRREALPETNRCYQCSLEKGPDIKNTPAQIGMDKDTYRDLLGAIRS